MSQEMSGIMMAVQQPQPGDEAADERFEADTQLAVERSLREAGGWRTIEANKRRRHSERRLSLSDSDSESSEGEAEQARARRRTWESRDAYAWVSVALLTGGLAYSVAVNLLPMFPATMCLHFAGGSGCDPGGR